MLQIAVINESTAIADGPVQQMIPAFSTQWNTDLKRIHSARGPRADRRLLATGFS